MFMVLSEYMVIDKRGNEKIKKIESKKYKERSVKNGRSIMQIYLLLDRKQ